MILAVTLAAALALAAPQEPLELEDVRAFLAQHCQRCHGPERQKGGHDFTQLADPRLRGADSWTWEGIAERLSLGEMPPREEERPDAAATQAVVSWICETLAGANAGAAPRAHLRRLNGFEYRNSLRDLLGIELALFDPTADFPPDESSHGFDNVGEALVSSGLLLDRQLDAADAALARALRAGPPPERRALSFEAPFMEWGGGLLAEAARTRGEPYEDLYTRPMGLYGYLVPDALRDGVHAAGYYTIRVLAEAVGREHPYERLFVPSGTALRMGIVAADRRDGRLRGKSPSEVLVAEFELAEEGPRTYERRVWLEPGYVPRVVYLNGPELMPQLEFLNLRAAHHPELLTRHEGRAWKDEVEQLYTLANDFLDVYVGPRVRVHRMELDGPQVEEWPPRSTRLVLGDEPERAEPAEVLARFARRAFRRPLEEGELDPFLALAERVEAGGAPRLEALRAALQALLCAPPFLYLVEEPGRLGAHALAARLAMFLWSSIPDEELSALADSGALLEPGVLRAQAERMLRDPRTDAFVEHFTERWLGLHRLGEMPPDPERHAIYHIARLEDSLALEPRALFAHLLAEDLDVGHFLASDFTFVDETLARFYGIEGVRGRAPVKVRVPDARRGGLLGQAAVLTVTANGIDTSPVVRGVWVLENLLGEPPEPPPDAVEPLEPDTRGAVGVREQLARHREAESCMACHRSIDPMGFPLESYDAIGRWRAEYEASGRRVDPTAMTEDGVALRHVGDLKQYLVGRKRDFARCLAEKLVTYATGAPVEPFDRAQVEAVVASAQERGFGLRALVLAVVESELFATR